MIRIDLNREIIPIYEPSSDGGYLWHWCAVPHRGHRRRSELPTIRRWRPYMYIHAIFLALCSAALFTRIIIYLWASCHAPLTPALPTPAIELQPAPQSSVLAPTGHVARRTSRKRSTPLHTEGADGLPAPSPDLDAERGAGDQGS